MLVDLAVVTTVVSVLETWQKNSFLMSLFPTIITKEILGRNVALTKGERKGLAFYTTTKKLKP
jgi:hypothetical protein